jgi:GNAT superfamily N-acetyltransferase
MNGSGIRYQLLLPDGLTVMNTQAMHVHQLEELQRIVFPTLADDELIRAEHYLRHIEIFPEGQFVITDKERVIGMTTTMRCDFDFDDHHHTFKETISGGWMSNHDPRGEWLYGLDMGLHPEYRGRGLSRILYRSRQEVARMLGLRGQLTVGMMMGYGELSHLMSGKQYYEEMIIGERTDPTLTVQMRMGFEPVALISEYLNDPSCGNFGVLIKLDADKVV